MGLYIYSVVAATRTDEKGTRHGWIVERAQGIYHSHVSILYKTQAEAEAQKQRLEALDLKTHGR